MKVKEFPESFFKKIYSLPIPRILLGKDHVSSKAVWFDTNNSRPCWETCTMGSSNFCCKVNQEMQLFPGELEFLRKSFPWIFEDYDGDIPKSWKFASRYVHLTKSGFLKCVLGGKGCFGGTIVCRTFPIYVGYGGEIMTNDKAFGCIFSDPDDYFGYNPEFVQKVVTIALEIREFIKKNRKGISYYGDDAYDYYKTSGRKKGK